MNSRQSNTMAVEAVGLPSEQLNQAGSSMTFWFRRGDKIESVFSRELDEILAGLMRQTGDGLEEIVTKAILLYQAVIDSDVEGKRVAVLDQDDEIVQEITGL